MKTCFEKHRHEPFHKIQKRMILKKFVEGKHLNFVFISHLNQNLTQKCQQSFSKNLSENSTDYCSANNNYRT